MIGDCGITWQNVEGERIPEIGYHLNRSYWHNGYAIEAATACKEYSFKKLRFDEVYTIVRDTNIASINVAIRNGMIIRFRIIKHYRGVDMPHFVFSIKNESMDNYEI
jgi:RimJ/RimL family protein N-acetyltransferase